MSWDWMRFCTRRQDGRCGHPVQAFTADNRAVGKVQLVFHGTGGSQADYESNVCHCIDPWR